MGDAAPLSVLLVDDDVGDLRLTREALERNSTPANLFCVRDGESALAFLRKEGDYTDMPTPDCVVLDLNMPRMAGLEFLSIMRADPAFEKMNVVVLTTSATPADEAAVMEYGATAFMTKPHGLDEYLDLVAEIHRHCTHA